jgi:Na+(H+)/acetate symporter ActP
VTGTGVAFSTLDWAVVAAYFVANTAICLWAAMLKEKDTSDYFLASRNATWWLIGSSIFASNIGAEHLIGLASSGAKTGEDRSTPISSSSSRCSRRPSRRCSCSASSRGA